MVNYKKFKIGDLFDIHPTKSYNYTNKKLFALSGTTPVITNTSINNGIGGYTMLAPTEKGNIITFSDTTTGDTIFYQPCDFVGYSHIQGLYPIYYKERWTEKPLLYFLTLFKKQASGRFDYATKFNRKIVANMEILLPITTNEEIDFEYMEEFVNNMQIELLENLKKEHNELINKYLECLELCDSKVTIDDMKLINVFKDKKICSKKIKIGDLFNVESSRKKFNANTITFGGKYPYVVRSNINNGIKGYITEDEKYLNPKNTISFGQDTATIFYQENEYFTGDKIKILTFKPQDLDRRLAFYLITAMKKSFQNFSWGQSSFNEQIIKDMEIELPFVNDKIDYDFMRKYIEVQEKIVINKIMGEKKENLIKISELIRN